MFNLKSKWGNHKIYNYDTNKHPFIEYIQKLFNENELDQLHFKSKDYNEFKDVLDLGYLNDKDTDLHKVFYNDIKNNNKFKILYCNFIKDIYKELYPGENYIIYQTFPSIRIQYDKSVVIPPHYDSDHLSNHPVGEKNFLIPITRMFNTNSLYIESEPGKKDFKRNARQMANKYKEFWASQNYFFLICFICFCPCCSKVFKIDRFIKRF